MQPPYIDSMADAVTSQWPGLRSGNVSASVVVDTEVMVPAGPVATVLAAELVERTVAEHRVLAGVSMRERLLAGAWLASYRSAATRAAYARDVALWMGWLHARKMDVLGATRLLADQFAGEQLDAGAARSSVCRRLAALSGFYGYLAQHDLVAGNPVAGVERPAVNRDNSATVGLGRDQARAVIAAGDADTGRQRLRTAVATRLLVLNGLRVAEVAGADVADLGHDRGHRVLWVERKGGHVVRVALAPATVAALDAYLGHRAEVAGVAAATDLAGPLLATASGHRLDQCALWRLVRRLARAAGVESWKHLSPHSMRHTAITLALDAGAPLRDVQDFAGHADPRTTRRYDRARGSLDRHPTYTLASYLASSA